MDVQANTAISGTRTTGEVKVEPTEYVVLRQTAEHAWKFEKAVKAFSADLAIKAVVGKDPKQPDAHVAVPMRSWKPKKPVAKVETTITLEDA